MPAGDKARILIVDDNRAIHDDFRKILLARDPDDTLRNLEASLFGDALPARERQTAFQLDSAYQGSEALALVQRAVEDRQNVTQEVEAAERAALNASKERELLERLSVATQAAGVQCWEFDVPNSKVTWLDYDLGADRPTPESVQAAGDAQFALILPEDLQLVKEQAIAATERQQPMISVRYRRRDPEGGLRYIQSYHRFFYDEHGKAIRGLGANIDITESHRRQMELEALSIRFEIATRTAQAGVWEWQERTDET